VSEYGVHWNFFVSLACVWFISDSVHTVVPAFLVTPLCVCVVACYQWLLTHTPLTDWIIGAHFRRWGNAADSYICTGTPRHHASPLVHFLRANREGLVSVVGYSALYLFAEDCARRIFWQSTSVRRRSSKCDLLSCGTHLHAYPNQIGDTAFRSVRAHA
jgi:phosphatidylinositol glycan class W